MSLAVEKLLLVCVCTSCASAWGVPDGHGLEPTSVTCPDCGALFALIIGAGEMARNVEAARRASAGESLRL